MRTSWHSPSAFVVRISPTSGAVCRWDRSPTNNDLRPVGAALRGAGRPDAERIDVQLQQMSGNTERLGQKRSSSQTSRHRVLGVNVDPLIRLPDGARLAEF